jgi:hypothetical protein
MLALAYDNDALIPEVWAQEALMQLENNMVAANLVHRDFEDEIASFGDVVNAHRPDVRTAKRKTDSDSVSTSTTSSTNVQVPLNQHIYDSFIIKDGEESKSFKDLIQLHLVPAARAMAQCVDEIVCTQVYQFLANGVGGLSTSANKALTLNLRKAMNDGQVPMNGRQVLLTPQMEADLLDIELFTGANTVGDDGSALREGHLGRRFGLNFYMDQNMPSISAGNTVVTGAINNASGYSAGTKTFTVDGLSAAITNGCWITIAGDMTPLRVASTVGGATPTSITTVTGIKSAVADDAVVTIYTPGAVNYATDYSAGYSKNITVDGFTVAPQKGQLISFGTATNVYGALQTPTTTKLPLLDRPLVAAVADDAAVGIGPAGEYGMGFVREAIGLVTRPLALPRLGTGAMGAVASYNGLSMRVVIQYDSTYQGHRVNLDMLAGVATMNDDLAYPLYAK